MDTPYRLLGMKVGMLFALLTLAYGFALGGLFGVAEDSLKEHLQSSAAAVLDSRYAGDEARAEAVTSKSWSYFKRAHLHASGLGTSAMGLIVLMSLLPAGGRLEKVGSALLGVGALGYSSFWMLAGLRAPGLGSTGAAKESLQWLAVPTSGACIVGIMIALWLFVRAAFGAGTTE